MDIIFQSGEFLVEQDSSLLQSLLGALIGAGTAILIFLWEGKRIRKNERLSKESELLDLFDNFNEMVNGILQILEKQIPLFKEHAEKVKASPLDFHLVQFILNQDLERISKKKMNLDRIYHAYLLKNENNNEVKKEFKNLISLIDHEDFPKNSYS